MGRPKSTFEKMQREKAKRERRREKLALKEVKKQEKAEAKVDSCEDGEDPALAGIVAGPQPIDLTL